jgi:energy-coupling factor transporter transmembrane protein EcfT
MAVIDKNASSRENILLFIAFVCFVILYVILSIIVFTVIKYPKDDIWRVLIAFMGSVVITFLCSYLGALDGIALYFYPVKMEEEDVKVKKPKLELEPSPEKPSPN